MRRYANRFKSLSLSLTLLAAPGFLPAQAPSFQEPQAATKEERKNDETVIDWLKKNASDKERRGGKRLRRLAAAQTNPGGRARRRAGRGYARRARVLPVQAPDG